MGADVSVLTQLRAVITSLAMDTIVPDWYCCLCWTRRLDDFDGMGMHGIASCDIMLVGDKSGEERKGE